MEGEKTRKSQDSRPEDIHSPSNDKNILECVQTDRLVRSTKRKKPDCCTSRNDCSPLLYSEDDCEYEIHDESESTSYCQRSTDQQAQEKNFGDLHCSRLTQVLQVDSSASPNRFYELSVNCLTSTPDRCPFSSSCSESEESEVTYTSQTVLLHISSSSSSSSTGNPVDYNPSDQTEKQRMGFGAYAEKTSDFRTEWESNHSECQCDEKPKKMTCQPKPSYNQFQVLADGPSIIYKQASICKDVIQAVKNIRVPVGTKEWAVEYLNQMDVSIPYPVKRQRLQ